MAGYDFSPAGGQQTSAQINPKYNYNDSQMWYYGGQQQGPPGPTNPIRQTIGNIVEAVGNAIPGKEGYLSEKIAGGPTQQTGKVQAYETPPQDQGKKKIENTQTTYINVPGRGTTKLSDAISEGLANDYGELIQSADNSAQKIMEEAQAAYNAIMGYTNDAEGQLRGFQPAIESGIRSTADVNKNLAQTTKDQSERQLVSAEGEARNRLQQGITAGRQILSESLQGYGQRFGAASNITKALGEYAGTKFQQTQGALRSTAEQTYQKINEQRTALAENFKQTTMQIDNWLSTQITSAQQEFQSKLLDISRLRAEAEGNKSALRIQALKDLGNVVNSVKAQSIQFKQQVALQNQAADAALRQQASALSGFGDTSNLLASNATANTQNSFALPGVNAVAGAGVPQQQYVGSITPTRRPEDEVYGIGGNGGGGAG